MTSNKFDALAAEVDVPFKVTLIDALTDTPIVDNEGQKAFIEVWLGDSTEGQLFDKESRRVTNTRLMSGRKEAVANEDSVESNKRKTARLTKSWYLVDPATKEPIDVPCTQANALELYMSNRTHHIWQQVWMGAIEPGNFIKRSPTISADTASTNGDTIEK
jgi:predicted transcriptional regulator